MSAEEKKAIETADLIEGQMTRLRIAELRLDPVKGNFDVDHLKEINRRIFQDFPNIWFSEEHSETFKHLPPQYLEFEPGGFRSEVMFNEWRKERLYESKGVSMNVIYSRMDEKATERLELTLKDINPAQLKQLSEEDFTKYMGGLYAELDYIHPFPEGNSRTLREFTRQLADESGFNLNWEHFNKNAIKRDELYIARDLAVIEKALPQIEDERALKAVSMTKFTFKNLPHITEALQQEGVISKNQTVSRKLSSKEIMSLPIAERPKAEYTANKVSKSKGFSI